jgi:hypothetical protein
MASVTTSKQINLGQLSREMGGKNLGATATAETTEVTCYESGVTNAALQSAVDAHVAVDEDANRATLEQRAANALAANNAFLALASPTNAQTLAQVKVLTRECSGLIRLALGLLDTTDGT